MVRSVSLCAPGPHALLLAVPLEEFPERDMEALKHHMDLLGERAWRHTVLLFTCEEELPRGGTIEEHIGKEKALQWLVEQCGRRYHVLNNAHGSPRTQVTELLERIEEMVAENGGDFYLPQVYHDIIESKTQRKYTDPKLEYEERVQQLEYEEREQQLQPRWRKREEELEKQIEELRKTNSELKQGMGKRRRSIDVPTNMVGEKAENYITTAVVVGMTAMGALIGSVVGSAYGPIGASIGIGIGLSVGFLLVIGLAKFEARAAGNKTERRHAEIQGSAAMAEGRKAQ
ncbi:hypothetical protein AAFF_G00057010 [Aldrovandia affinis]|uniref:AIG1-type G domain-containing protein n=1 Tax=Aldrovandia affinis TaxID=143900 RepID=A0AAD7S2Z7_9TELE|nr:hypothetical protein AAFF_G00057010 [Aldrovandia affinis]